MENTENIKSTLYHVLDSLSEYHPDLAPSPEDSEQDLLEKYFYWVDEYNDGYDPNNFDRPDFI